MGIIAIQKTTLRIAVLGLLMVILPFIGYSQSKRAFLVGISNYSSNQHLADGKGWNDIHGENDVNLLVPVMDSHSKIMMEMRAMVGMKLWSHSMP